MPFFLFQSTSSSCSFYWASVLCKSSFLLAISALVLFVCQNWHIHVMSKMIFYSHSHFFFGFVAFRFVLFCLYLDCCILDFRVHDFRVYDVCFACEWIWAFKCIKRCDMFYHWHYQYPKNGRSIRNNVFWNEKFNEYEFQKWGKFSSNSWISYIKNITVLNLALEFSKNKMKKNVNNWRMGKW